MKPQCCTYCGEPLDASTPYWADIAMHVKCFTAKVAEHGSNDHPKEPSDAKSD